MAALSHYVSPTECQVLQFAARGFSAKETALALGKSPETVKSQLGMARLKLGAKNSTHAAVLALHAGLIAA